jgi:hypothetical protein
LVGVGYVLDILYHKYANVPLPPEIESEPGAINGYRGSNKQYTSLLSAVFKITKFTDKYEMSQLLQPWATLDPLPAPQNRLLG